MALYMDGRDEERLRALHRRGKMLLVVIFCAMFVAQSLAFVLVSDQKHFVSGVLLCNFLWTTMLLGAMWRRHKWARGFLILLLIVDAVATVIYPTYVGMSRSVGGTLLSVCGIALFVEVCAIWILSSSRGVKALMRS